MWKFYGKKLITSNKRTFNKSWFQFSMSIEEIFDEIKTIFHEININSLGTITTYLYQFLAQL